MSGGEARLAGGLDGTARVDEDRRGLGTSTPRPLGRPRWRAILVLAGLSLGLRLALVPYYASKPLFSDFQVYAEDARRIARGDAILDDPSLADRAPVYPLFLAAIFVVFGPSLVAAYTAQAVVWTAAGTITWAWARDDLGDRSGLVAAGLVLFHPDGLVASGLTGVECLSTLFLACLLLRFSRACRGALGAAGAFLTGALAGAAVLTITTIGLLVALALPVVAFARIRRGLGAARLLLIPAGMALVIAPWTARNALVLGSFVPLTTISGTAFLGGNNASADGEWNQEYVARARAAAPARSSVEWSSHAWREGLSFIRDHPVQWLGLELLKAGKFFSSKPGSFYRGRFFNVLLELTAAPLWWMPILFLTPLGMVHAGAARPSLLLASLAVVSHFAATLVFFALVRYRIPYIPAFSVLAVHGGASLLAASQASGAPPRRVHVVAVVAWGVFILAVFAWIGIAEWEKVLLWLGGGPPGAGGEAGEALGP